MLDPDRHTHCSYCGHPFDGSPGWPRRCAGCNNLTFCNPVPVAVVLQPVDDGVLVIRRGIAPRRGELALPGGFMDRGERWQETAVRELREETGIEVAAGSLRLLTVESAPDGSLLIFGEGPPLASSALPLFEPNDEVTERLVLREPATLAFEFHTQVVAGYFARRAR